MDNKKKGTDVLFFSGVDYNDSMKKHTKKVVITEVTYETVDGKFFSNPSEALRHEERLEANKQFLNLPHKVSENSVPWTYCESEDVFKEFVSYWRQERNIRPFNVPVFHGPDWYRPLLGSFDLVIESLTDRKEAYKRLLEAFEEGLSVVCWISEDDLKHLPGNEFVNEVDNEKVREAVAKNILKNRYWFSRWSDGEFAAYPVLSDGSVLVLTKKDWRGFLKEIYNGEKQPYKTPEINDNFFVR